MKKCLASILSDVVFIMLINVKMPTIVGILTFMSRINFVLSRVEHGKSFITLGPVLYHFTTAAKQTMIKEQYVYFHKRL